MNVLDYKPEHADPVDYGVETHVCVCGNNMFRLVACFEDGEIAGYMTDMECIECGARYKTPCILKEE